MWWLDKSYGHILGVPKLRARLQPQTALAVGSEDHSQISYLQRAPKDTFPIASSCFHISGNDGKPVVTFCNSPFSRDNEVNSSNSERTMNTILWFIGPAVLVASLGFPLICLPEIFCRIFRDKSLTGEWLLFQRNSILWYVSCLLYTWFSIYKV